MGMTGQFLFHPSKNYLFLKSEMVSFFLVHKWKTVYLRYLQRLTKNEKGINEHLCPLLLMFRPLLYVYFRSSKCILKNVQICWIISKFGLQSESNGHLLNSRCLLAICIFQHESKYLYMQTYFDEVHKLNSIAQKRKNTQNAISDHNCKSLHMLYMYVTYQFWLVETYMSRFTS